MLLEVEDNGTRSNSTILCVCTVIIEMVRIIKISFHLYIVCTSKDIQKMRSPPVIIM